MHTGGIYERHTAHANDANGRMILHLCRHLLKAIGHSEEEGAVDFIDLYPIWDDECLLMQRNICYGVSIGVNLFGENRQLRHLCHAAHEEQAGEHQTEFDGNGEIKDNSEHECHEQYHHITLGAVRELGKGAPLAHIVAHHHQDTCQSGHRDISCQRHGEEENHQQHQGMNHPSNARASTIVDVGHGAGYSPCGRDAAKERSYDVGNALSDEFLVRIVVIASDTIGYSSGE